MTVGIIKWFSPKKGYGFVVPGEDASVIEEIDKETSEEDIFVHWSSIETPEDNGFKTLFRGDKIEYSLEDSDKGKEAKGVSIIEKSERRNRYKKNETEETVSEDE